MGLQIMVKCPEGVLYKKNVSLKKYNTFKLKSIVSHFFMPETLDGFINLIKSLNYNKEMYLILGGGSNILFLDDIVNIPVIYTGFFSRIEKCREGLIAYGGVKVSDIVYYSYKNLLTGIEFLAGLPGTIGGATYMNARCYGHSISDIIESIGIIDENGEYRHLNIKDCEYDYKKSIFQKKAYTIIEVKIALDRGIKKNIKKKITEYKNDRKKKKQYKYPSAGSVFLNDYKSDMVAGKIIDSLNMRGIKVGGAMISPYHANFIINYKNAKGMDIYQLMKKVRDEVYEKKNIRLRAEVKIIGNNNERI